MEPAKKLLVINVGSTSTKVAIFKGEKAIAVDTIRYTAEELSKFSTLEDQLPRREEDVINFILTKGIPPEEIDLIVSRGGLGKPSPAGAYRINEKMCSDLIEGKYGKHPSALGPAMALRLSEKTGKPAIVIDAPSTDEFQPIARISGIPEVERKSAFHALNQKAAARRLAKQLGKRYEEINCVVAHIGGGITIGAHRKGEVIDCTHGLSEGPFTPERAGGLPSLELINLAFSGKYEKKQLESYLVGRGGLTAYLGTNDAQKIEEMISKGDEKAKLIYEAMAYQIAKDIGAMATVLKGELEAIVITGGLAHSSMLINWIEDRVKFIAPVFVFPGEDEMQALAEGGLRVLSGEEKVAEYE
ncbi:MAG: butyrate kinase [Syntrophales bacterium]|nr:butyrate kinase [Syntrophales bacterium]